MAETKLPDVEKLAARVDEVLERVRARFDEAQKPDAAWAMFKESEIRRRMEARKKSYLETSRRELEDTRKELAGAMDGFREEVERRLHPLQTSRLDSEQRRGDYSEEYAHRLARTLDMKALAEEYRQAMEAKRTDLGSSLLEWGERFLEKDEPQEFMFLEELKAQHLKTLGVDELFASRNRLRGKLKLLDSRMGMFLSYGKTEVDQAENIEELQKMLEAGGLA